MTLSTVSSQAFFMADDNAPLSPKQLDVTQAEAEHVIQPHSMANDFGPEAMAVLWVGVSLHALSLGHPSRTANPGHRDNAFPDHLSATIRATNLELSPKDRPEWAVDVSVAWPKLDPENVDGWQAGTPQNQVWTITPKVTAIYVVVLTLRVVPADFKQQVTKKSGI